MADKVPPEIWANPPDEYGIGLYGPKKEIELGDERYIHESHYQRLLEAYKELLEAGDAMCYSDSAAAVGKWHALKVSWKSEIEEVEGL